MNRREFLTTAGWLGIVATGVGLNGQRRRRAGRRSRVLGGLAAPLADPVLANLAAGTLAARMPVEQAAAAANRRAVTYLEALGPAPRGLAPWIELAADDTPEGRVRAEYAASTRRAIARAVDPASPDFMNFTRERQPLVDAAFLAQALLRARRALRRRLDATRQAPRGRPRVDPRHRAAVQQLAAVLGDGRSGLRLLGEPWDRMRVDYALRQHEQWYKGDGVYGDGPEFHWDYYNSFVIQPMLLDVLDVCPRRECRRGRRSTTRVPRRARALCRHPGAPDCTRRLVPAIGRSMAYRCGAFQSARADRAPARAARRRDAAAGPRRARGGDSPHARRARYVRCRRLAAHRLLRSPARRRRDLHLDGQSVSVLRAFLPLGLPHQTTSGVRRPPWTSALAWSGQPFPIDRALAT